MSNRLDVLDAPIPYRLVYGTGRTPIGHTARAKPKRRLIDTYWVIVRVLGATAKGRTRQRPKREYRNRAGWGRRCYAVQYASKASAERAPRLMGYVKRVRVYAVSK